MLAVALKKGEPYSVWLDNGKGFICKAEDEGTVSLPCRMSHSVTEKGDLVGLVRTIGPEDDEDVSLLLWKNQNLGSEQESRIVRLKRLTWDPCRGGYVRVRRRSRFCGCLSLARYRYLRR